MAQYLLSVCHDEEYDLDFDTPEMRRIGPKVNAVNEEMQSAGAWVFGAGLLPASSATVIRPGDELMTDGPYVEAKEQMGGFWVIEAPDRDAALEWSRKAAAACERPVELRPMHE
jgi:hypothetical protein